MNTTRTIGTWLPVFPGFYNTLFDTSESEYLWVRALKEESLVPEDWECQFAYAGFTHDVCKEACSWVESVFVGRLNHRWGRYHSNEAFPPSAFGVSKCEFEEIVSPKEYNFTNDAVNCLVTLDATQFGDAFTRYVAANAKEWAEHLIRHYRRYDGFCSFYPYDPEEWAEQTANFTFALDDTDLNERGCRRRLLDGTHALGRCMEFLLENELPDAVESLYYHVAERVYPDQYITNYPQGIDTSQMNESFTI